MDMPGKGISLRGSESLDNSNNESSEHATHNSASAVLTQNTECKAATTSSTINPSATEPATHSSASVVPTVYDSDLLLRICPAHLIGAPCEYEDLEDIKCDRLFICEHVENYVCQGTTCKYLHGIPGTCLSLLLDMDCDGCNRAHDLVDARLKNAEEVHLHCTYIEG
ncbi:hypothetical protein AbraIFM66951_006453 [Aspergillus brasiliensis]|uniref:C3H1-type domain-containing protein n=1 Tax=Aspergillus brasiliensis TaxID=319629 RepID=A0A9W5YT68_9EURO|nr:hypothetical protein AbraCBS73388_008723 [Aspergillus brasiliensis]GKZ40914.1 hypothetical protein AbraIFM66951_006453 [Aspergillus brasiliensis]